MLSLADVHYRYGAHAALQGVSLELAEGQIMALLGPNGAGKSTLVSLITGSRRPLSGQISLNGQRPWRNHAVRRHIGWVPQTITLYPRLTVEENLRNISRILGVRRRDVGGRVDEVLPLVGLEDKRRKLAGALSGGQQRLLNVALGLVHHPTLLVLDEPTAGVDSAARRQLKRILRNLQARGLAILLTTHELEDADELADQLAILVDGRIRAAGPTGRVIAGFFQDKREVSITLAARAAGDSRLDACQHMLRSSGLAAVGSGHQWTGLIDNRQRQVDHLVHALLAFDALIREVRVRDPSLDALMNVVSRPGAAA